MRRLAACADPFTQWIMCAFGARPEQTPANIHVCATRAVTTSTPELPLSNHYMSNIGPVSPPSPMPTSFAICMNKLHGA